MITSNALLISCVVRNKIYGMKVEMSIFFLNLYFIFIYLKGDGRHIQREKEREKREKEREKYATSHLLVHFPNVCNR